MRSSRRPWIFTAIGIAVIAAATTSWFARTRVHFLDGDTKAFVASFTPPPARGSRQERSELEQLLALQRGRDADQVAAALADRKTEISRFAGALHSDADTIADLPRLAHFADDVEDDERIYVRAAKRHFRRLRPAEIEPAVDPCIGDVAADLSYPSGHATYGYLMAQVLAGMVPERQAALEARGRQFALQRVVCGVHFPSDVEAGKAGAHWLYASLSRRARFATEQAAAAQELRAALGLPPLPAAAR